MIMAMTHLQVLFSKVYVTMPSHRPGAEHAAPGSQNVILLVLPKVRWVLKRLGLGKPTQLFSIV
jgi:hypothetical protein